MCICVCGIFWLEEHALSAQEYWKHKWRQQFWQMLMCICFVYVCTVCALYVDTCTYKYKYRYIKFWSTIHPSIHTCVSAYLYIYTYIKYSCCVCICMIYTCCVYAFMRHISSSHSWNPAKTCRTHVHACKYTDTYIAYMYTYIHTCTHDKRFHAAEVRRTREASYWTSPTIPT